MSELDDKSRGPVPTSISVSAKRTINTGNYESVAFEAGMQISVPPDANVQDVFKRGYATCQREIVKAAIAAGVVPE